MDFKYPSDVLCVGYTTKTMKKHAQTNAQAYIFALCPVLAFAVILVLSGFNVGGEGY